MKETICNRVTREDNIKSVVQRQGTSWWTGLNWLRSGQVARCCEYGKRQFNLHLHKLLGIS